MPKVFDLIRPLDERDTYAITDVIYQKGGLREVENIQERDAITTERRSQGMIAFISSTAEFYALNGKDLTNNSWEKIDFSKNLQNALNIKELSLQENSFSRSDKKGENLSISVTNSSILKIKEGNSVSSLMDENKTDGKLLFVQNIAAQEIKIKNNYFQSLRKDNVVLEDEINLKEIIKINNKYFIIGNNSKETSDIIVSETLNTFEYLNKEKTDVIQSGVYGNSKIVLLNNNADKRIIYSEDEGETWNYVTVEENEWQKIIFAKDTFVAISKNGVNRIMYSMNAIDWNYIAVEPNEWQDIVYGKDTFVAISKDGENRIMYSMNAIDWSYIALPTENFYHKIKFLNNNFYLISDLDVLISEDGVIWNIFDLPFSTFGLKDIAYNGYYSFFKNSTVYYTFNFEKWHEFNFINEKNLNNVYCIEGLYYLLLDSKIISLRLEVLNNDYSILTGLNRDTPLMSGASMLLQFSSFDMAWRVIGSLSVDPTFLQLLDTPDQYPQVEKNNNMFLLINPDQTKQDKIIFENPFPVINNKNNDLVIKNINGLRIRKFDNETGEIIFAKFEPNLSLTLNKLINFDDEIKTVTVNVTNDSFVEDVKVNKIISLKYYKNDNYTESFEINTIPVLPSQEHSSHSWNEILNFNTISDINPFFKDLKTPFVLEVILKDTENKEYIIKNTVSQTSPDFNFNIENKISDFRDEITECDLKLTYTNISNKNLNSQITSITSNSFNSPIYKNLTKGINSYLFDFLSINADHVIKTDNLNDNGNFVFTTVCRFTRPQTIDSNQNYFEITKTSNLNVTFAYPIFIGITDTFKTSLTKSDILNLFSNEGNSTLPRKFNYSSENTNTHWWFCVRKRYVNNKKIGFILTSSGFTLSTNVIHNNEVEIPNFNGTNETYVCYCIILQANTSYSINVIFE